MPDDSQLTCLELDSAEPNTRRLGVNAAFLQEIKSDNRFLDELLLATRDALSTADSNRINVRSMVELLRRLRDRLAMHFALEEAFGYCEDSVRFPHEWSLEARAYRDQHAMLYLDVCDAVESAERLLYHETRSSTERLVQRVSSSFNCFYRRLQLHEAGENALISAVLDWHLHRGALRCPGVQ